MGKIKVTLLGTSAAVPSKHRNLSGTVLNFDGENFLFDCGEGTQKQLMLSGNSFMKVNNVFVSHFHADHWLGLVGLIATMGLMQRQQKLKIFGPKGIKERVLTILPQFNLAPQFEIEFKELREGKILEGKNFEISTFKLKHSVTSYGFVFQEHGKVGEFQRQKALDLGIPIGPLFAKLASGETVEVDGKKIKPEQVMDYSKSKLGKKISFVFDTCFVDSYLPAIQNSDLLIHECTFSDELQKKAKEVRHCTSTDAANAAKLSTSKKLVLNHISAREKEEDKLLQEAKKVFTNTVVGKDLQEFEV